MAVDSICAAGAARGKSAHARIARKPDLQADESVGFVCGTKNELYGSAPSRIFIFGSRRNVALGLHVQRELWGSESYGALSPFRN